MPTAIPYLDENWPIVTGCRPDFPCWKRCWARGMAHRFHRSFRPTFNPSHLVDPMRWRRPRNVGVAFTGDLFADGIKDSDIATIFGVMEGVSRHRFFVITKRAERMARVLELLRPVPDNIVLMVSASDQAEVKERAKWLLRCPAKARGLSLEPLLGPIELSPLRYHLTRPGENGINWVVTAAESGPHARPINLDWVRRLRDDCAECDGTAFMYKDQRGFPYLDGRTHSELP
jgi:protein gp37